MSEIHCKRVTAAAIAMLTIGSCWGMGKRICPLYLANHHELTEVFEIPLMLISPEW